MCVGDAYPKMEGLKRVKIKLGRGKRGNFWASPIEYKINYFLFSWLLATWNQDFISPTYLVNIATGHLVQNWAWLVMYRLGYYEMTRRLW